MTGNNVSPCSGNRPNDTLILDMPYIKKGEEKGSDSSRWLNDATITARLKCVPSVWEMLAWLEMLSVVACGFM